MIHSLMAGIAVVLLAAPAAGQTMSMGLSCDELRAQVEARIRAAGVTQFSVTAVDAAASAPGREVGRCERGARKLLYRQHGAADAPARRQRDDDILTECRDGTVTRGGNCGR
jgi:hypothetical protein